MIASGQCYLPQAGRNFFFSIIKLINLGLGFFLFFVSKESLFLTLAPTNSTKPNFIPAQAAKGIPALRYQEVAGAASVPDKVTTRLVFSVVVMSDAVGERDYLGR